MTSRLHDTIEGTPEYATRLLCKFRYRGRTGYYAKTLGRLWLAGSKATAGLVLKARIDLINLDPDGTDPEVSDLLRELFPVFCEYCDEEKTGGA